MSTATTGGGTLLAALHSDRAASADRMAAIAATARGRSMTDDEQHDFDVATREVAALDQEIAAAEARGKAGATIPPAPIGDAGPATMLGRMQAAAVAKICIDGGAPELAAGLLSEGSSVDEARARVAGLGEVKALVTGARRLNASIPTDFCASMLAEGKSLTDIRTAVLTKLAADGDSIALMTERPPTGEAAWRAPKPVDLVADMKRRHRISA